MLCSACAVGRLHYSSGGKVALVPTFSMIISEGGAIVSLNALASSCRPRVSVRAATTSGMANRGSVITKGDIAVISAIALSNLGGNAGCRLGN